MNEYRSDIGKGRTEVTLRAQRLGSNLVITIYNNNAHIGAVSLGEYDPNSQRSSTSLITRIGHKDDVVAQKAAHRISKATKRPICVIAGIHVDRITKDEISEILENADSLVEELIQSDFLRSSIK